MQKAKPCNGKKRTFYSDEKGTFYSGKKEIKKIGVDTARQFYKAIRSIHVDQEQFAPYPDAAGFLSSLKELGLHIIIASHREKGALGATFNWLNMNHLVFDEIHLSNDKSVLFDDCLAVIDDSPLTLEKAVRSGIIGTGLKMPWNMDTVFPLFDNLTNMLQYLNENL